MNSKIIIDAPLYNTVYNNNKIVVACVCLIACVRVCARACVRMCACVCLCVFAHNNNFVCNIMQGIKNYVINVYVINNELYKHN